MIFFVILRWEGAFNNSEERSDFTGLTDDTLMFHGRGSPWVPFSIPCSSSGSVLDFTSSESCVKIKDIIQHRPTRYSSTRYRFILLSETGSVYYLQAKDNRNTFWFSSEEYENIPYTEFDLYSTTYLLHHLEDLGEVKK